MKIIDVTRHKQGGVVSVDPETTVADLLMLLARHNIGAVVVTTSGAQLVGIVSERDIVRHLNADGAAVLNFAVSSIMTTDVHTCSLDDEISEVAGRMTLRRIRHMPVIEDGELVHIVSIGDIVKHRIDQLTAERDALENYISM